MCDLDQNDGSIQRTFTGAGVTLLTALLVVGKSSGLPAADPWPVDTFDARARLVVDAAMTDVAKLNGGSPMHYWIAQRLFEQGERDQALAIVKPGVKAMRTFIEKREAAKHENIGANGFIYWASLNCYVHWHRHPVGLSAANRGQETLFASHHGRRSLAESPPQRSGSQARDQEFLRGTQA